MGIISWLVLGLLAGAIAKLILPGKQGGGWIITLILGVVGALLGGFIASAVFSIDVNNSIFELSTWLFAIGGAIIVLLVYGLIVGRKGGRTSRA